MLVVDMWCPVQRKKAREAARVADDEGWTTVVYGRKRADIEGAAKDVKKKKKPDQMLNFYRWQQREQRRDRMSCCAGLHGDGWPMKWMGGV
jgi:hypothetical protein